MDNTMIKRLLLPIILLASLALPVFAQDSGGQLWIQAFEDRNGNGQRDAGEPFLTHGVSVDLLNADGVVVGSGTLDGAPYASQGFIGFLYLAPGQYTAVISSPDMAATLPDRVPVTITAGAAPVTVSYGAQITAPTEITSADSGSTVLNGELARVAIALFGAVMVLGLMSLIGVGIYAFVLRPRYRADVRRTTTGSLRPVSVTDSREIK